MKIKMIAKLALICVAAISVAACSSTKKGSGADVSSGAYVGGAGGVTTMGLGDGAAGGAQTIAGYGISDAYRLKGGYNQIYFFDFNQSDVNAKYNPSLSAQANYVASHPQAKILLTGNTDERGSSEYNIALGNRRALAVASILKAQGVSASHVRVLSYGSEKPIAQGHDEHAWALNRNVQLIYQAK